MKSTFSEREIHQAGQWRGSRLSPLDEALLFHGPAFLDTLRRLLGLLETESIEYLVIGELALAAHGSCRSAPELEICMRDEDLARFRERLAGTAYESVEGRKRRFRDAQTQIGFAIRVSGDPAGHRVRNREVRFPDPAETIEVQGLRTVSLERLIALRLVTWRFRGWADVIELIRVHHLDRDFARKLPESARSLYFNCYEQMLEEDRAERELDQR